MRLLNVPEPLRVRAVCAAQPRLGSLTVGVMRTEPGDDAPFARLLVRGDDEVQDVTLAAGESVEIKGHGRLTVEHVVASTRDRRGWVDLLLQPAG